MRVASPNISKNYADTLELTVQQNYYCEKSYLKVCKVNSVYIQLISKENTKVNYFQVLQKYELFHVLECGRLEWIQNPLE